MAGLYAQRLAENGYNDSQLDSIQERLAKAVDARAEAVKTGKERLVGSMAGVMQQLIEKGKILHWGVSEADEAYIRRAHKVCPLAAVQNRHHMMYRAYESLFPVLEELNIGFVPFSPLANGFLSG